MQVRVPILQIAVRRASGRPNRARRCSSARADRIDVHHGNPHGIPVDQALRTDYRLRLANDGDVATGTADVDRNQIVESDLLAGRTSTNDTGRGPGKKEAYRP